MDEPDPQVVAAAQRDRPGAFETLVRAYQGPVWRLVFQLVHDEHTADDVTQETFLRAYRFLPRYRGSSKFSTWLLSVARNCAMDELRRNQRRRRLADKLRARPDPVATERRDPVEIRELLQSLPMDLREPIVLIDVLGIPYAEVAVVLGTPIGTVKSRVHRARALLGAELATPAADSTEARRE